MPQFDVAECVGLVVIGAIAVSALVVGGPAGIAVAGTAIGGISGYITRTVKEKAAS